MARSVQWWVLATGAVVLTLAVLVVLCGHGAAGAPAGEDPIGQALVGA
jgi:hypothetical protein